MENLIISFFGTAILILLGYWVYVLGLMIKDQIEELIEYFKK